MGKEEWKRPRAPCQQISDVTGPVGAKFDLQNQPISNLKLRTGSRTGSTG